MRVTLFIVLLSVCQGVFGQDYFLERYKPFDTNIPSPEQYLGYGIGDFHTRHDQIISYFKELDRLSDKATYVQYGKSHEGRPLGVLVISTPSKLNNLDEIRKQHLGSIDKYNKSSSDGQPLIVNLGYSVHGNEPSTSEAAVLTAYTLVASKRPEISNYLDKMVVFIDPAINPDGRERHTQWANMYRAEELVADNDDVEHNENWPRGRVNHYWFDLNRDWYLAIHPESRAKLEWYHQWYPNVIGDFHEMGTNSSFFFEPMKTNGSKNPIMPKENYIELNDLFAKYYIRDMDSIGSLYFTKEVFDGTYPGYGSSYGDLQGGLALLFEQASSRGHVQETDYGDMTFAFTIRNQYVAGMSTLEAALKHKSRLQEYMSQFFASALTNANADRVKAYTFVKNGDQNRTKAFIDKLLIHKVDVYENSNGSGYVIPTAQRQYRIVQSAFETYNQYQDSVFYDASAWSLAHFYNINFKAETASVSMGKKITTAEQVLSIDAVKKSDYAYLIDWADYNSAAMLDDLQNAGLTLATSLREYGVNVNAASKMVNYGSLILPVGKQTMSSDDIFALVTKLQAKHNVPVFAIPSGYSTSGVDIGSRTVQAIKAPKPLLLIGEGTSAYEAGEVWHHLDQKIGSPVAKVAIQRFKSLNLSKYNTLIMVSGSYSALDSMDAKKIRQWVSDGNTLITIAGGSQWAIRNKIVKEKLVEGPKRDPKLPVISKPYMQAEELLGKESLGGAIFKVDIDRTHPLCFGYSQSSLPVYKNNTVWLSPSENEYSTISRYSAKPHIDGYISPANLKDYMSQAASTIVSQVGSGRAIMFADNPVFRGSWYGTDKMLTNAIFFGDIINVPSRNRFGADDEN